jgi:hypothetical protein
VLPKWPNPAGGRLGGFDLGLSLHPDEPPRVVLGISTGLACEFSPPGSASEALASKQAELAAR